MQTRLERGVGVLGVVAAVLIVSGAGQRAPGTKPSDQSALVFRATAELVQFDAVVLDAARRPVSTLTIDDFEVRQDGALVELRDVAFIDRASRHAARGNGGAEPTVAPRVGIDVEPLIFLIDDMVMSPGGFDRVRTALRQFVDAGLPPGLEVGILRTGETGRRTTALTPDAAGGAQAHRRHAVHGTQQCTWKSGAIGRRLTRLPATSNAPSSTVRLAA